MELRAVRSLERSPRAGENPDVEKLVLFVCLFLT